MEQDNKHLVIFRSSGLMLNFHSYNCQELGLAGALTKKGWKVSVVFAGKEKSQYKIPVDDLFFDLFFLKCHSINQALCLFDDFKLLLEKLHPDIIEIHDLGMLMSYMVVKWAKLHNVRICLIQGPYETTQKPIFKQMELLYNYTFGKYILNNVDGIGCKTTMASHYIHRYCDKPTMPVYIGLDKRKFKYSKDENWRNKLQIEDKKVLLYVGVQESRRNPLFLINLIDKLPADYVLLMVGEGPQSEKVREVVSQRGLYGKCKLLGKLDQEELPSLYRASDMFLLASDYEIYGMVILEAMFFGTPVISSYTAGSEVVISSGEDGIIMPNYDIKEWTNKIESLCNNPERLKQVSAKAKEKIEKYFLWDKAVDSFIKLYNNCS